MKRERDIRRRAAGNAFPGFGGSVVARAILFRYSRRAPSLPGSWRAGAGRGRTLGGSFRGPKPKAEKARKPLDFKTNPLVTPSLSRREPGGGFVLVLPLLHPTLNEWARRDTPWAQRERKEKTTRAIHEMLRFLGLRGDRLLVPGRVIVTVLSVFGDRRRRDFDNYVPKFFLDALRGIVFEDDATNCVVELRLRHAQAGAFWRTEITIEPAPEVS